MNTRQHLIIEGPETILSVTPHDSAVVRILITIKAPEIALKNRLILPTLATMLTRGTAKMTKEDIEDTLERKGIRLSFDADAENLTISLTTRTDTARYAHSLLFTLLTTSTFPQKELRTVLTHTLQDLHDEREDARARSRALLSRALYPPSSTAYIPSIDDRVSETKKITRTHIQNAHKAILANARIISIAAPKEIIEDFRTQLKKLPKATEVQIPPPEASPQASQSIYSEEIPGKKNIEVSLGVRIAITQKDTEFIPLAFGVDVLGKRGGFAGRLMSTVREKEGLTYSIYAWIGNATKMKNGHVLIFTFFTAPDFVRGITATMREVKKLHKQGITKEELVRFKELLTNQHALAHESTGDELSYYHGALCAGHTPQEIHGAIARIGTLTKKEVGSAIKRHLIPEKFILCGAGPTKDVFDEKALCGILTQ